MKKVLSKIFIIICVMGLIAVTLSSSQVQAILQSNPNTHYTRQMSGTNWMIYFRNMEKVGEALGLSETIDGITKLATSESNNIDSHMIKSTEFGAIAILSASGYGNPKTLKDSTLKTTTGNETGIYFDPGNYSKYTEVTAGGYSVFAGIDGRYYDAYTSDNSSAKVGDALGTASTTNPGCTGWHSASYKSWPNSKGDIFVRNKFGLFSFDEYSINTDSYSSRGVIVCGEGF